MIFRLVVVLVSVVLDGDYLYQGQQRKEIELRHTTSSNVENLRDTCAVVPNR